MTTSDEVITIYGTHWCPDCNRAKKVFARMNCPYKYVDIDQDELAREFVQTINNGFCSVPTIVFIDGSSLTEPDNYTLEQKLILLGY